MARAILSLWPMRYYPYAGSDTIASKVGMGRSEGGEWRGSGEGVEGQWNPCLEFQRKPRKPFSVSSARSAFILLSP